MAEGTKSDKGKPPIGLCPTSGIVARARVFAMGAEKYGAHNFRDGLAFSRLVDAALRHILAWKEGEDLDDESGLSHLAHAGCEIDMLLELIETKPEFDDRFKRKIKLNMKGT